ncbi:MAG: hypothetical protein PHG45_05485 [Dehalococcoidales bacterium]|nr:hypothetical protein [Dehalococcoidales bacterium]
MKPKGMILSISLVLAALITSLGFGIQAMIADDGAPPRVNLIELTGERDSTGMHSISEEEKAKVLEIALSDTRLKEITNGIEYSIGQIANWVNRDCDVKIGGVVEIILHTPQNISYDWPLVSFETDSDVLYQKITNQSEVFVGKLYVGVDLRTNEVIKISPDPA